ncbi:MULTISPECIES: ATP-binding protein [unclassified Streptomyces]|uniref:ATP-binding protein n=1 Tax=Streptomyces sp. NBC_00060 TaxID=2975636 RepID=A0AAU2H9W8_9ACTN
MGVVVEVNRQYTLDLEAAPERVPQIRRIVAAHLRYWKLECLIQPVSLGVCELLTNVFRHTEGDKRCTLELRWTGRRLTAAVLDRDPRLPVLGGGEPLESRGRGLAMVASLSDSWGTHGTADGKVVWFTLRAEVPDAQTLVRVRPLRALPEAQRPPTAAVRRPLLPLAAFARG